MISKEEYIRLYCDDSMYKNHGVVALSAEKLGRRMDIDPIKTIRDLDDYGFSDAMRDTPLGPIESVSVLNTKTGKMRNIPVDGDLDALEKALQAGNPTRKTKIIEEPDISLEEYLKIAMDPESFDWGNEDMIP